MKIFASWSGDHSKEIAKCFADWLPKVIQGTEVFVSPRITSGDGWFDTIMSNLKDSDYGIAFVTQDNVDAAWLQFESGALALKFEKARISPVLCDMDNTGLPSRNPLSNFQAVKLDHQGLMDLLTSILSKIKHPTLRVNDLEETLALWESGFLDETAKITKSHARKSVKPLQKTESEEENSNSEIQNVLSDVVGEIRKLSSRVDNLAQGDDSSLPGLFGAGFNAGYNPLAGEGVLGIPALNSPRFSPLGHHFFAPEKRDETFLQHFLRDIENADEDKLAELATIFYDNESSFGENAPEIYNSIVKRRDKLQGS